MSSGAERHAAGSLRYETVNIRGTSDGLIVTLGEGPFEQVLAELETRLAARASFFRGGRVALQAGERGLSALQLETLGQALEAQGVTLWAVESSHPATHAAARELGLETLIHAPLPLPAKEGEEPVEELPGIVVRRTLRSGQAVEYVGHVTLLGDVNAGAEVVAGGDVVIWGKLRGTVHAGAMGDDGAVVCAIQLQPTQLRIGTHVARSPERGKPPKHPEIAHVADDQIVVERWDVGR